MHVPSLYTAAISESKKRKTVSLAVFGIWKMMGRAFQESWLSYIIKEGTELRPLEHDHLEQKLANLSKFGRLPFPYSRELEHLISGVRFTSVMPTIRTIYSKIGDIM